MACRADVVGDVASTKRRVVLEKDSAMIDPRSEKVMQVRAALCENERHRSFVALRLLRPLASSSALR
jgi:hypothetical protein